MFKKTDIKEEQVPTREDDDSTAVNFSSATKLLQILALYSPDHPLVRLEEVTSAFNIAQSTAYRYLRELAGAGLIAPRGKGAYSLGRRIVELERVLQLSDPLLLAGKPVMNALAQSLENRAFALCTLHNDRVLSIYMSGPKKIQLQTGSVEVLRGRGTSFSLFTGAGSRVILAFMPPHQIKSIYLKHTKKIEAEGLGATWKDFRSALGAIRKKGYARTPRGTNPNIYSSGVPILDSSDRILGSLLMIGPATQSEIDHPDDAIELLKTKADEISAAFNLLELREMAADQ